MTQAVLGAGRAVDLAAYMWASIDTGAVPAQESTPLPSASDLATLHPAVAITLLVASVAVALLVYVGPALKERLRPPKANPPTAATPTTVVTAHPPSPVASAVGATEARTNEFIDSLMKQIEAGDEREDELKDRIRDLQRRLDRSEADNRSLEQQMWRQRGDR